MKIPFFVSLQINIEDANWDAVEREFAEKIGDLEWNGGDSVVIDIRS